MAGYRNYKKTILETTEGVLETVTDLVLVAIFFGVEFGRRPTITAADRGLAHLDHINYQTLKKTTENLIDKKLVARKGESLLLTGAGRARLGKMVLIENLEMSRQKGEVYLIIYDIANDEVNQRNNFRRCLLRNKMAKIQESVYLSGFDPRKILEDFMKEHKVSGQILVTKLGKDSIIGGQGINEFLWKVYKLEELEKEYLEFVEKYEKNESGGAIFAFNRIFKKDPGLPMEFLPDDWIGAKALEIYEKVLYQLSSR